MHTGVKQYRVQTVTSRHWTQQHKFRRPQEKRNRFEGAKKQLYRLRFATNTDRPPVPEDTIC